MTDFSPLKSSSLSCVCRCATILTASCSVRTTWRDGRTRGLSRADRLDARMLTRSAVVPSSVWRSRRTTPARSRMASSCRSTGSAPARGRKVVENEESVRAGEADRVDVRREPRRADVVLEAVGDGREDPVVRLPAEELLEAEELADLQVDDAEVLDPLVDALGRLEGMDRKVRDAVVDDALAAEVQVVQLRRRSRGRHLRGGKRNLDDDGSVRRLALILPPWCRDSSSSDRTFRRSSSAPKGFARKSEPPSCIAVMRSLTSERPVRKSTGTSRVVDWRRRIAQNSQPVMPGMFTSRITRSGTSRIVSTSAARGSAGVSTAKPAGDEEVADRRGDLAVVVDDDDALHRAPLWNGSRIVTSEP